jgi:hypothetical protein
MANRGWTAGKLPEDALEEPHEAELAAKLLTDIIAEQCIAQYWFYLYYCHYSPYHTLTTPVNLFFLDKK